MIVETLNIINIDERYEINHKPVSRGLFKLVWEVWGKCELVDVDLNTATMTMILLE